MSLDPALSTENVSKLENLFTIYTQFECNFIIPKKKYCRGISFQKNNILFEFFFLTLLLLLLFLLQSNLSEFKIPCF